MSRRITWLLIVILAIVAAFTYLAARRNYQQDPQSACRSRPKRRKGLWLRKERRADKMVLNPQQQRTLQMAIELRRRGKIAASAQALESIGMIRESIEVLERGGNIKEAASALIRMQRPNRAGALYARHGRWSDAAQCFRLAQLPLEAGRAYRMAGMLDEAIECFQQAQRFSDAALCFSEKGLFAKAARYYFKDGMAAEAVAMLQRVGDDPSQLATLNLESAELDETISTMMQSPFSEQIAKVLNHAHALHPLILALLAQQDTARAEQYLAAASYDIGPQLIADVNYLDPSAHRLAELMQARTMYGYAGIVFERLEEFATAGECFQHAGEIPRAKYCYERANDHDRAARLIKKGSPADAASAGRFTISEETSTIDVERDFGEAEPTIIMPVSQASDLAAPKSKGSIRTIPSCFASSPLFMELGNAIWNVLLDLANSRTFNDGQVACDIQETPDGLIMVTEGTMTEFGRDGRQIVPLRVLGPGDVFAESWIFADIRPKRRLVANGTTQTLVFPKAKLTAFMETDGTTGRTLYKRYMAMTDRSTVTIQNQSKKSEAS